MSGWDWSKVGTAGLASVALLASVYTEPREPGAASALFTLGILMWGVWLTQTVIDWWRGRGGDGS